MARRYSLRASDSDREDVAERLRAATAEGRLLAEELEERLEVALNARTYGELDALVVDLPAPPATVPEVTEPTTLPACLTVNVTVPSLTIAFDGLLAVTPAVSVTGEPP